MIDRIWVGVLAACAAAAVVFAPVAAADPAALDPTGNRSGGPVPTANGVPCVGDNLGACLSIRQNSPSPATPRSTLGHSPTVRR